MGKNEMGEKMAEMQAKIAAQDARIAQLEVAQKTATSGGVEASLDTCPQACVSQITHGNHAAQTNAAAIANLNATVAGSIQKLLAGIVANSRGTIKDYKVMRSKFGSKPAKDANVECPPGYQVLSCGSTDFNGATPVGILRPLEVNAPFFHNKVARCECHLVNVSQNFQCEAVCIKI